MRTDVVSKLVLAVVAITILTAGGRQGHLNETAAGFGMTVSVLGHAGWSQLLGDPGVHWMRNVLMLSWLAAPAIFSRGDWW